MSDWGGGKETKCDCPHTPHTHTHPSAKPPPDWRWPRPLLWPAGTRAQHLELQIKGRGEMTALLLISAVGTQPLHLLASRGPCARQSSGPRNGKIKGWRGREEGLVLPGLEENTSSKSLPASLLTRLSHGT